MIYTKFGMANIKREIPNFIAKQKETRDDGEPSRFQRNIKVKVEISKYNTDAGKLSLSFVSVLK